MNFLLHFGFATLAVGLVLFTVGVHCQDVLKCMSCKKAAHFTNCEEMVKCDPEHEVCYVEEEIDIGGETVVNAGCREKDQCDAIGCFGDVYKRRKRSSSARDGDTKTNIGDLNRDIVCHHCCNGDFCNMYGCPDSFDVSHLPGSRCFVCEHVLQPEHCNTIKNCEAGYSCGLERVSFGDGERYNLQCIRTQKCDLLKLIHNNGRKKRNYVPLWADCCDTHLCNGYMPMKEDPPPLQSVTYQCPSRRNDATPGNLATSKSTGGTLPTTVATTATTTTTPTTTATTPTTTTQPTTSTPPTITTTTAATTPTTTTPTTTTPATTTATTPTTTTPTTTTTLTTTTTPTTKPTTTTAKTTTATTTSATTATTTTLTTTAPTTTTPTTTTPTTTTTTTTTPTTTTPTTTTATTTTPTTATATTTTATTTTPTTATTTTTTSMTVCENADSNCNKYNVGYICTGSFADWAKQHCAKYCGFCGATTQINTNSSSNDSSSTSSPLEITTSFVCDDIDPDCDTYGVDYICKGSYAEWAKHHCTKYCGYCETSTQINANTSSNDSSSTSSPLEITTSFVCKDIDPDCNTYGVDYICKGSYAEWAKDHCTKYCGYCGTSTQINANTSSNDSSTTSSPLEITTSFVCEDIDPDCDTYGVDYICKGSYAEWAKHHCTKYCGYCGTSPQFNSNTSSKDFSIVSTTPSIATASICEDKDANCDVYGEDYICKGSYAEWAKEHCTKYCGHCVTNTKSATQNQTTVTTPALTTATTPALTTAPQTTRESTSAAAQNTPEQTTTGGTGQEACVDLDSDCHEYGFDYICQGDYIPWSKIHCANYCKLCTDSSTATVPVTSEFTTDSQFTTEEPVTAAPHCADLDSDCHEYGNDYICQGDYIPWSLIHCNKTCNFCHECIDKDDDCADYGSEYICNGDYLPWAEIHCAKFCNICQEASPPPSTTQTITSPIKVSSILTQASTTMTPTTSQPSTTIKPTTTETSTTMKPASTEPSTTMKPASTEPSTTMKPASTEPSTTMKPASTEPSTTMKPASTEPSTTMKPASTEPSTTMKPASTEPSTTMKPASTGPSTTMKLVTTGTSMTMKPITTETLTTVEASTTAAPAFTLKPTKTDSLTTTMKPTKQSTTDSSFTSVKATHETTTLSPITTNRPTKQTTTVMPLTTIKPTKQPTIETSLGTVEHTTIESTTSVKPTTPKPTTTTKPTTIETTPLPPSESCGNKLPDCESYDMAVCMDPEQNEWMWDNCRAHCKMCLQSRPCKDEMGDCAVYKDFLCTDPTQKLLCKVTCGLC